MLAKWTTGGKSLRALSILNYLATSYGKEFGLLIPEKGSKLLFQQRVSLSCLASKNQVGVAWTSTCAVWAGLVPWHRANCICQQLLS